MCTGPSLPPLEARTVIGCTERSLRVKWIRFEHSTRWGPTRGDLYYGDVMADSNEKTDRANAEHPMTAWLVERLTGPRGREDWNRVVEAGWQHCLATPLRTLIPPDAARTYAITHLDPDRMADLVRPVVHTLLPALVEHYRKDTAPLGRWVPDAARGAIERMVSRPGLVHEEWIRALFRQRVVEAVMADALYRGIRDFSTIMPRLVLSLMPTQRFAKLGGAGAIGKRIVEELEKRIEPEIKVFLEGGTKRALARAADFAVGHRDDDAALAFRRNVVQFVLSKSPSFHAHAVSDEMLADLEPIAQSVAKHMAGREESKRLVEETIAEVDRAYGAMPLGEALRAVGLEKQPDREAWAAVTWPAVVECANAPGVRDWLDGLVRELLERHETSAPESP